MSKTKAEHEAEIDALNHRCTSAVDNHGYHDIRTILIKVVRAVEFGVVEGGNIGPDADEITAHVWDILKDSCLTFRNCKTCGARTAEDEVCEECREKAEQTP